MAQFTDLCREMASARIKFFLISLALAVSISAAEAFPADSTSKQEFELGEVKPPDIEAIQESIDHNCKEDRKAVEARGVKKEIREVYESRCKNISLKLHNEHFLFDDVVYPVVQEVVQEVVLSNPELQAEEIRFWVARYGVPNAVCRGEGTFYINLGLLRFLRSKDELAFVVAHELAHLHRNHVNEAVESRYVTINSKEFKEQLSDIKRQEYNQNASMVELLKDYIFDENRHSRFKETEADSLAMLYLANTNYTMSKAVGVIELLDTIDSERASLSFVIKSHFDFENYPFKSKWLYEDNDVLFGGAKSLDHAYEVEEDSIKTHPDCEKRLKKLRKDFGLSKVFNSSLDEYETDMLELHRQANFALIATEFEWRNYDHCLFHCLQLLNEYPNSPFLKVTIAKVLNAVFQSRIDHKFSKYVSLPDPDFQDGFKQVVLFLNNLRKNDFKNILFHYMEENELLCSIDEDFAFLYLKQLKEREEIERFLEMKSLYEHDFPNGNRRNDINQL